jgi:hypothetical protein
VCNNLLCFLIEDVKLAKIHSNSDLVAGTSGCTRINTSGNLVVINIKIKEYFGTKKLVYTNGNFYDTLR